LAVSCLREAAAFNVAADRDSQETEAQGEGFLSLAAVTTGVDRALDPHWNWDAYFVGLIHTPVLLAVSTLELPQADGASAH